MSEKSELEAALRGRRMDAAARSLGMSRRTLQNKMRRHRMVRRRAGRPRKTLNRRHKIAGIIVFAAAAAGIGLYLTKKR